MAEPTLRALVDPGDIEAVWKETAQLLRLISPGLDLSAAQTAFTDMRRLFTGTYPGWRACNTDYHDLNHTTDTILAMARLMHGAQVSGTRWTDTELTAGAISAMFHDSGYIQAESDTEGTGARYTVCHEQRSIVFLAGYLKERGWPAEHQSLSEGMLLCTSLRVKVADISFGPGNARLLGQMLGAADLLCQMAARTYLEKLLFLYYEFQEGKVPGFRDEFDLLQKTFAFYEATRRRLADDLGGVDRYMLPHFRARWGLGQDLYAAAIEHHIDYLRRVIAQGPQSYREMLRRDGLMEKLEKLHGRRP
jgi:hypothetical protein